MTAGEELQRIMSRLRKVGGGIVLFHDTKPSTAAMLPQFLKELKDQAYRVVHVVPASAAEGTISSNP